MCVSGALVDAVDRPGTASELRDSDHDEAEAQVEVSGSGRWRGPGLQHPLGQSGASVGAVFVRRAERVRAPSKKRRHAVHVRTCAPSAVLPAVGSPSRTADNASRALEHSMSQESYPGPVWFPRRRTS
jgi:hypothetical protein